MSATPTDQRVKRLINAMIAVAASAPLHKGQGKFVTGIPWPRLEALRAAMDAAGLGAEWRASISDAAYPSRVRDDDDRPDERVVLGSELD